MLAKGALLQTQDGKGNDEQHDVDNAIADSLEKQLGVRPNALARVGADLPVQLNRAALEQSGKNGGDKGECEHDPGGADKVGNDIDAGEEVLVEEQEDAHLQPENDGEDDAGDEDEDGADMDEVWVIVCELAVEDVAGGAESQVVVVDDDACGDEEDGGGDEEEAGVVLFAVPYGHAGAQGDNEERDGGAGVVGSLCGRHGGDGDGSRGWRGLA